MSTTHQEPNGDQAVPREHDFLTAEELSNLLRLPVKTIYALAKARQIPGRKYGKQWRFRREDVLEIHRRESVVASRKEVDMDGITTPARRQNVLHRPVVPGRERKEETLPPFDWSRGYQEGSREVGDAA
jgi:excisionase family DNA binding protein